MPAMTSSVTAYEINSRMAIAARRRRGEAGEISLTSQGIDERHSDRPDLPKEPMTTGDTKDDDKRVQALPGSAMLPRFGADKDAEKNNASSRHQRDAPIRERYIPTRDHSPIRQRPAPGRILPQYLRVRPRRFDPHPLEVSHEAVKETAVASRWRSERPTSAVEGARLSAMYIQKIIYTQGQYILRKIIF